MSEVTTYIETKKRSAELSRSELVPALGFNKDAKWFKKRLRDFQSDGRKVLKAGPFGSAIKKEDYVSNGYKVYGQEQVIKGDPFYGSYFIDNQKFNELKSCNVQPDDLLISLVGTFGKVLLIPENAPKGIINPRLLRISASKKELIPNYLKCFFSTHVAIKSLAARSQGGTMGVLNAENVGSVYISYPSIPEQQKIASFLSAIDEKIQQLSKKKTLLEDYKKGVMQQLFSGKLRFKDENGKDYPNWEEKKINNLFKNVGGTALEKYSDKTGSHKFISIGNYSTNGKYIDNGQRVVLNEKSKTKLLNKGDLVMVLNDKTKSGDIIGSTILIDEDNSYIYNQRSERLICNPIIQSNYAWVYLNSKKFRKEVFSVSQGGTQIYVNFPAIKKLSVLLPSLKEQQKIASYLSSIDSKIEIVNNQISQTQSFKKGLLQQMFV